MGNIFCFCLPEGGCFDGTAADLAGNEVYYARLAAEKEAAERLVYYARLAAEEAAERPVADEPTKNDDEPLCRPEVASSDDERRDDGLAHEDEGTEVKDGRAEEKGPILHIYSTSGSSASIGASDYDDETQFLSGSSASSRRYSFSSIDLGSSSNYFSSHGNSRTPPRSRPALFSDTYSLVFDDNFGPATYSEKLTPASPEGLLVLSAAADAAAASSAAAAREEADKTAKRAALGRCRKIRHIVSKSACASSATTDAVGSRKADAGSELVAASTKASRPTSMGFAAAVAMAAATAASARARASAAATSAAAFSRTASVAKVVASRPASVAKTAATAPIAMNTRPLGVLGQIAAKAREMKARNAHKDTYSVPVFDDDGMTFLFVTSWTE